jgi:hypothetical protein
LTGQSSAKTCLPGSQPADAIHGMEASGAVATGEHHHGLPLPTSGSGVPGHQHLAAGSGEAGGGSLGHPESWSRVVKLRGSALSC